ncbi:MAG: hypothetical protein MI807_08150, partial [Verrucomicrobiales bacterium]|nr:hypothetical protein [Verrucomicrobiales bacterium]
MVTIKSNGAFTVDADDSANLDAKAKVLSLSTSGASNPFSGPDSTAVAGIVSRNDVDGGATATVSDADVDSASIAVKAKNGTTIDSTVIAESSSSGGGTFGNGSSLAVGGVIATNNVLGDAFAEVLASDLTTTAGDVYVEADNAISLTAFNQNQVEAGDTALGMMAAYNSLGYEAQNLLFQNVDALLGAGIGNQDSADAEAYLTDTTVASSGAILVDAINQVTLDSEISNEAKGEASGFTGQNSMAASIVIASNYAASSSNAAIRGNSGTVTIRGAGEVTVRATEKSVFDTVSTLKLVSSTDSTNAIAADDSMALGMLSVRNIVDGGATAEILDADIEAASILLKAENDSTATATIDAEASASGGGTFGAGTQLAVNGVIASNTLLGGALAQAVDSELVTTVGDLVVDADNSVSLTATNANQVSSGDTGVAAMMAFNTVGYEAEDILTQTLDAFVGTNIGAKNLSRAEALITDSNITSANDVLVDAMDAMELAATFENSSESSASGFTGQGSMAASFIIASNMAASGSVAAIQGPGGTVTVRGKDVRVTSSEASELTSETKIVLMAETESQNEFSADDAISMGLASVRNIIDGDSLALVDNATIEGTSITVKSENTGSLDATLDAAASASGGGTFGAGTQMAVNGVIASNTALGGATARVEDSELTTTGGDVTVDADNNVTLRAENSNQVESGDTGIAAMLAFNTLGFESENLLNQQIDAFIGGDIGNKAPAMAEALILDTDVDSAGAVIVDADNLATLTSVFSNSSVSSASGFTGQSSMSASYVITSNFMASGAVSAVRGNAGSVTVKAVDAVSITASDTSDLNSSAEMEVRATTESSNEFSSDNALAFGMTSVRNVIDGGVTAEALNASIESASLLVESDNRVKLTANLDAEAESGGGGTFGAGDQIAANGIIASNTALGKALAQVVDSTVTTTSGDVTVDAENAVEMTSKNVNQVNSGDTGIAAMMAFNTLGYESEDILAQTLDAFIGTQIGDKAPASAEAYITNSVVTSAADVTVDATNNATLTATFDNSSESSASGFTGQGSMAVSFIIASNMVSSGATAAIRGPVASIRGRDVSVHADDTSVLDSTSNVKVVSETESTNPATADDAISMGMLSVRNVLDGGVTAEVRDADIESGSVIIAAMNDADLTSEIDAEASASGGGTFGAGTQLAVNAVIASNTVLGGALAQGVGSTLTTDTGDVTVDADNSVSLTATNVNQVSSGDTGVAAMMAFNTIGYEAEDILSQSIDALIGTQIGDKDSASAEAFLTGTDVNSAGDVVVSADNDLDLTSSFTNSSTSSASGFTGQGSMSANFIIGSNMATSGAVAAIRGDSGTVTIRGAGEVDVSGNDTSVLDSEVIIEMVAETESTNEISADDAIAVGAAFVRNVQDGGVTSEVRNADIESASIQIAALNDTTLAADLNAEASASGGGTFGAGTQLAVNGVIASNTVTGAALAQAVDSTLTATTGDIRVSAENSVSMDADNTNEVTSGDTAIGYMMAFNTLGYDAEDILTQTLDALIGTTIGSKEAATASALITNTNLDAAGNIDVIADNTSDLSASFANEATGEASGLHGQGSMAASFVLSSNFVASGSVATIDGGAGGVTVKGTDVTVSAADNATIDSFGKLDAVSATESTNSIGADNSMAFGGMSVRNDLDAGSMATVTNAVIESASFAIRSQNATTLKAEAAADASASGGGDFGAGTQLAVAGLIVSNNVVGNASAEVIDSTITADTGDVVVDADNLVKLEATNKNRIESGDTAVGFTMAFNTLGYEASNILYQTLDALLGTDIGTIDRSDAVARLVNTSVDAQGGVFVTADNTADLDAVISNEATGSASGFTNQSSTAASFLLASNMVAGGATVTVDGTNQTSVKGGGAVLIAASDDASLDADVTLVSESETETTNSFSRNGSKAIGGMALRNDLSGGATTTVDDIALDGASIAIQSQENSSLSALVDSQMTSDSNGVGSSSLAVGAVIATNSIVGNATTLVDRVTANSGDGFEASASNAMRMNADIRNEMRAGETSVGVTLAFNTIGIDPQNLLFNTIDALIGTDISSLSDPTSVLVRGSTINAVGDIVIEGRSSADLDATVPVTAATYDMDLTSATNISVGAVVSMNKVASGISADVIDSTLDGGTATVKASNAATIDSDTTASSVAIAGSAAGAKSFAIGAARAVNDINGFSRASVTDASGAPSSITTDTGDVVISSSDFSRIDALSAASAISQAASLSSSLTIGGAGTFATNEILTDSEAFLENIVVNSAGAIQVTNENSAVIEADVAAQAESLAISASGAKSFAVGVAVATNTISGSDAGGSKSRAYARGGSLIANDGGISVSSDATGEITASVEAMSAAIAASAGSSVTFSLGGATSLNDIDRDVEAFLEDIAIVQALGTGDVAVSASDSSIISASTHGSSAAANFSAGSATAISVGVAIGSNEIDSEVSAFASGIGSLTTADGDLIIDADRSAEIFAQSSATSLGSALSGGTGIAVSGAGGFVFNEIYGSTSALLEDSVAQISGATEVTATNDSEIEARIEVASAAISGSAGTGVGVSMGASFAENAIGDSSRVAATEAQILNSSVHADDELLVEAISQQSILAYVGATSAALTASGGTGVSVSGAGAIGQNQIYSATRAKVDGDRNAGFSASEADVRASEDSTIESDVKGSALAASISGGTGVAVSVGVSLASNRIDNEVEASIANIADQFATTLGDIDVISVNSSSIDATSTAASLAAGVSLGTGVGIAGAGAVAENIIYGGTVSFIDSADLKSAGAVRVNATNTSDIEADIISAAAALGVGASAGGSGAIGVSIARNLIGGGGVSSTDSSVTFSEIPLEVAGYIRNSVVDAAGAIEQQAISNQRIDSEVAALSAAVAASGGASLAAAGSGIAATNTIATHVFSDSIDSTLAGASVAQTASDTSTINAEAGAAAISVSVAPASAAISFAGILANNTISNHVRTSVQGGSVIARNGDIVSRSNSNPTMSVDAAAAAVSIGGIVAVAGSGLISSAEINNTTESYSVDADLNATGVATFDADSSVEVNPGLEASATGAALLGFSASTIKSQVDIANTTEAYVSGGSVRAGQLNVTADAVARANTEIISLSAGTMSGVSVIDSVINNDSTTRAYLSSTDVETFGPGTGVHVSAKGTDFLKTLNVAAGFGVVGGAVAKSAATVTANVEAYTENSQIDAANGEVEILAEHGGTVQSTGVGVSAGLVAVGTTIIGSTLEANVDASARGANSIQANDVRVNGKATTTASNIDTSFLRGTGLGEAAAFVNSTFFGGQGVQSLAFAGSGGIGALVGVDATSTYTANVNADLSDETSIDATGDVSVNAESNGIADSTGIGIAIGAVAVGFVQTNSTVNGGVSSNAGGRIKAQSLAVDASADLDGEALTVAAAGGLIGAAINLSDVEVTPEISASIADKSLIEVAEDVSVRAAADSLVDADTIGVDAGLVSVGASVIDVTMRPNVSSEIGDNVVLTADGSVFVTADLRNDSDVKATASGGKLVGVTGIQVDQAVEESVNAAIGSNSQVTGLAGFTLTSNADLRLEDDAKVSVGGGFAGQSSVATSDVRTTVSTDVGNASSVFSKGSVTIDADNAIDVKSDTQTQFYGAAGFNESVSETDITGTDGATLARTVIGQGAVVEGVQVDIGSGVSTLKVDHDAFGEQYAAGGFIRTTSDVNVGSDVLLQAQGNSRIIGETVNMLADHGTIDVDSNSTAEGFGISVNHDGQVFDNVHLNTGIIVDEGAAVMGNQILVEADGGDGTDRVRQRTDSDAVGLDFQRDDYELNVTSDADIVFNGDIAAGVRNAQLFIDENGVITTSTYIDSSIEDGDIVLEQMNAGSIPTSITLRALKPTIVVDDDPDNRPTILGVPTGSPFGPDTDEQHGSVTIRNGSKIGQSDRFNSIEVVNDSSLDLRIQDLNVLYETGINPFANIQTETLSGSFSSTDPERFSPTRLEVFSTDVTPGNGNIIIEGVIHNPTGSSVFTAEGGSILQPTAAPIETTALLTGAVNATDTTLTLNNVPGLGISVGSKLQIGSETVTVTAINGGELTVVRGEDGSTATSHGAGSTATFSRGPGIVTSSAILKSTFGAVGADEERIEIKIDQENGLRPSTYLEVCAKDEIGLNVDGTPLVQNIELGGLVSEDGNIFTDFGGLDLVVTSPITAPGHIELTGIGDMIDHHTDGLDIISDSLFLQSTGSIGNFVVQPNGSITP